MGKHFSLGCKRHSAKHWIHLGSYWSMSSINGVHISLPSEKMLVRTDNKIYQIILAQSYGFFKHRYVCIGLEPLRT